MQNNVSKIVLISFELFDFIPLWRVITDYETTVYSLLGFPVWKKREIANQQSAVCKKYYFLGIPIAEITDGYFDEEEEFIDDAVD